MASNLLDALATDHVLSVGQLRRHHGMSEEEAWSLGARAFAVSLSKTQSSNRYGLYRFVARKGKRVPDDGGTVRHLTGAAELRYLLGAPHDAWVSDAGKQRVKSKPDAIWTTPEGVVAIEYDSGCYDPERIVTKLTSFKAGYASQIWGTPSKDRINTIKKLARNIAPGLEVHYAPWF